MGRLAAIVEALRGRATRRSYPRRSVPAPEGFRGPPFIDPAACIGCGACTHACPVDALTLNYNASDDVYVLEHFIGRCIMCGLCAITCPHDAIEITREYELATSNYSELFARVEHRVVHCSACGEAYATAKSLAYASASINAPYMALCTRCRARRTAEVIASAHRGWR